MRPGGYDVGAGVVTVTWTERPWTVEELAARTSATNGATLRAKAATALTTNGAYLALTAPTAAQTTAQVKALTRECSAIIRLLIGALDTTTGT